MCCKFHKKKFTVYFNAIFCAYKVLEETEKNFRRIPLTESRGFKSTRFFLGIFPFYKHLIRRLNFSIWAETTFKLLIGSNLMRLKIYRKNWKNFDEVEEVLEKNTDIFLIALSRPGLWEGSNEGILLKLAAGTVNTLINTPITFY